MNERIRNLALDAGLINYIDNETPRRYFISGLAEPDEVENFAKLIVQECSKVCEEIAEMAEVTNTGEMARKTKATAISCSNFIKNRFGVE